MLCYKIYLSQFFEIFLKHFMNPRTWRKGHNIFFTKYIHWYYNNFVVMSIGDVLKILYCILVLK